ncbi:heparinase II/III family protein, partial [Candidatus Latescibacterota bacterium]
GDGSYGEGFSYLAHAMHDINPALNAMDQTFGVRFPEKINRAYKFLLYQGNSSKKTLLDFGDSTDRLGRMSSFTYMISKYRDPYLKWLYDLTPGRSDEDLLLMDDSVPAKSPDDLPTVKLFSDVGTAIFRSGFGGDDFVFVFRCGPFYNHQHFDQGGFILADRGEKFLYEMGKSSYYNDPWYQKLIIQPGGHNCILVDGNPESQLQGDLLHDVPAWNNHAAITDFMRFDDGGFASGRLDPLYKGKLGTLRRSVLYIEPRMAVIIDEAADPNDAREINLRFQAPYRDEISVDGNNAVIAHNGKNLSIRTLSPSGYSADIMKRPMTTTEFSGADAVTMKARGFLQLSAGLGSEPTVFVNVLSTDQKALSQISERIFDDHICLSVRNLYCINTTGGQDFTEKELTTDALVYATLSNDPRANGYRAMRTTKVVVAGETILRSDKPVSVVSRYSSFQYTAAEDVKIAVKLNAKPAMVSLDGEKITGWRYNNGMLSMSLSAGSGVLIFE